MSWQGQVSERCFMAGLCDNSYCTTVIAKTNVTTLRGGEGKQGTTKSNDPAEIVRKDRQTDSVCA
jgi:hypothetical protein